MASTAFFKERDCSMSICRYIPVLFRSVDAFCAALTSLYPSSFSSGFISVADSLVSKAKGDYIFFLDSDDLFFNEKLNIYEYVIEMCGSDYSLMYDDFIPHPRPMASQPVSAISERMVLQSFEKTITGVSGCLALIACTVSLM